jgi:hypothetical protein
VNPSSSRITLSEGAISENDHLAIELVTSKDTPQVILVRWPHHSTVIPPRRFADTASVIVRLFARASTELARIRASNV